MSSSFLLQIFYKDVQVKGVVVQYWRFGTKCHQCNCIARVAAKKSERETHIFATITSRRLDMYILYAKFTLEKLRKKNSKYRMFSTRFTFNPKKNHLKSVKYCWKMENVIRSIAQSSHKSTLNSLKFQWILNILLHGLWALIPNEQKWSQEKCLLQGSKVLGKSLLFLNCVPLISSPAADLKNPKRDKSVQAMVFPPKPFICKVAVPFQKRDLGGFSPWSITIFDKCWKRNLSGNIF